MNKLIVKLICSNLMNTIKISDPRLGKDFKNYYTKLELTDELQQYIQNNLLFNVSVYYDDVRYYFVHDDRLVYIGLIDKNNINNTIINDTYNFDVLTNSVMLAALKDKKGLFDYLIQGDNVFKLHEQNELGRQWRIENGHKG